MFYLYLMTGNKFVLIFWFLPLLAADSSGPDLNPGQTMHSPPSCSSFRFGLVSNRGNVEATNYGNPDPSVNRLFPTCQRLTDQKDGDELRGHAVLHRMPPNLPFTDRQTDNNEIIIIIALRAT